MRSGGGGGVEEEGCDDSGAFHRYSAIGDRALCVVFYFSSWGERWFTCPLYRRWRWAHCPLIEGLPPIRAGSWTWSLVAQAIGDQLQHSPP
jgi:hypothetical protein